MSVADNQGSVGVALYVLQPLGRTELDLDLIKQVEQGNKVRLGRRLPGIRSIEIRGGGRGSGIFNSQFFPFADVSLQRTAKTANWVLKNSRQSRFRILRDALVRSAPQDEVFYFKHLPHPEEARRAVSKGADKESRIFPRPVKAADEDPFAKGQSATATGPAPRKWLR